MTWRDTAPDGYHYGVMFNDGSVGEWFCGRTQRERCEAEARGLVAEQLERHGRHDDIRAVRRKPGGEWEEYGKASD